jgi:hypothetical protein
MPLVTRLGVARATSPDVRCGPPGLRSLGGNLAFAILAALGFLRRLRGTGNPELTHAYAARLEGGHFTASRRAQARGMAHQPMLPQATGLAPGAFWCEAAHTTPQDASLLHQAAGASSRDRVPALFRRRRFRLLFEDRHVATFGGEGCFLAGGGGLEERERSGQLVAAIESQ